MDKDERHGFLLVLTQPPPAMEEEFNAWYDTEHVPERVAVPGFLTGLRYVALDGHPRYLTFYDIERPAVLDVPAYRAVSGENFSPWTKRVTSRVLVDRRAGVQVWPGNAILKTYARLRLLRFEVNEADEAAEAELIDTLRALSESRDEVMSLTLLRSDPPVRYFALLGMTFAEPADTFFPRLGQFSSRIDQHVVYAPYDPRN